MRKYFIADAHLRNPTDKNYLLLHRFLSEIKETADTLFILGDLFEFWIGYHPSAFPHYFPILKELGKLSANGTKIIYFEGNHDFHMGRFFSEITGATIYPSPEVFSLDGKKCFLCHGDQIISREYGYRILRFLLRNRASKALFPIIPPKILFRIAEHMSKNSKTNHNKRNSKWNYELILMNFADHCFRENCDVVITAHFHIPLLRKITSGKERILLSLGDWITHFTFGEMQNGSISLHNYP